MHKLAKLPLLALLLFSTLSFTHPSRAPSAELVMFETRYCAYCRLFDRKVAPEYAQSRAGAMLPIKKVDIDRQGTAGYPLRKPIIATPTFVLFDKGRELARITGYTGKDNFFKIVSQMLKLIR